MNAYGAGKAHTERDLRAAFTARGLGYAVLRCFNAAGADPAGRAGPRRHSGEGLVEAACKAALELRPHVPVFGTDYDTPDGTCVRDYVHPADIAAAHVAALRALERGTHRLTLDCGCGRGWSVRQVLAAVERSAGTPIAVREAPRRRGDGAVSVAHTQAIRHALGWRPRYSELDVMVSTALAWISSLADGRAHGKRHGELVGRTV